MHSPAWQELEARKPGATYLTLFELFPVIARASGRDDLEVGEIDEPELQISYTCAGLVQLLFAKAGYNPPPLNVFGPTDDLIHVAIPRSLYRQLRELVGSKAPAEVVAAVRNRVAFKSAAGRARQNRRPTPPFGFRRTAAGALGPRQARAGRRRPHPGALRRRLAPELPVDRRDAERRGPPAPPGERVAPDTVRRVHARGNRPR